MPYFITLLMTGPKISKNLVNKQINLWPKCNLIALNRIMIEMQNKWNIKIELREGQQDQDVVNRSTNYKAYKVNTRS